MKRKRSRKPWRRLGIVLVLSTVFAILLFVSCLFYLFRYEDASSTPEGFLNGFYARHTAKPWQPL